MIEVSLGKREARPRKKQNMRNRMLHLFIPPQKYVLEGFSAGILSIASYVKQKHPDIVVRIHDLSHYPKEEVIHYLKTTELNNTKFIHFAGITTTTATYQSSLDLAKKIKQLSSNNIVIFGGHHAKSQADIILENHPNDINIIVRGEGEKPLSQLIGKYPNLRGVKGIVYREERSSIRENPAPPALTSSELDTIPVNINDINLQSPLGKFDHITYVSARGCPLKCHFCAVSNETIRNNSVNKVINDLKYLVLDKGFKKIAIEDNLFAQSPARTLNLCDAIINEKKKNPKFDFIWDCQTRVESVLRSDIVTSMKHAGCEAVYLGVENFDSKFLKYLGKTADPIKYLENTRKAVELLSQNNIDCYINLQIGLPGETDDEKDRNISALKILGEITYKHNNRLVIFPMLAVVYPGTYLFNELLKNGVPSTIFEDYTRWEEMHDDMRSFFSAHFAHGTGGLPTGLFDNIEQIRTLDFENSLNKAYRIAQYIKDIKKIPHTSVFDYSKFVVTPTK